MTRRLTLCALLLLAASGPACGKYGKPVRPSPAPAAAPGSTTSKSAQPGSVSAPPPAGEQCEEDPKEATP